MSSKNLTNPDQLEQYSFLWSQARLVLAAIALLLGGIPLAIKLNPFYSLYMTIGSLLNVAWIISGVASVYLLFRWNANDKKLFGGKDNLDTYAFFVSVISGINLGLTGILSTNIGMSISSNRTVFAIVAILYILSALHLHKRWNESGKKIFSSSKEEPQQEKVREEEVPQPQETSTSTNSAQEQEEIKTEEPQSEEHNREV